MSEHTQTSTQTDHSMWTIYIYMYINICIYIYVCIYICINIYIYICDYTTCAAVVFLCRKRCAVGKSMIYMSFLLDESIVCGIDFSNNFAGAHMFLRHILFEIETCWGWLANSLTHTEEKTVEEKSRVEETIYIYIQKRRESN